MKLRMMILLSVLSLASSANAINKVVYGEDDRLDLFEVSDNLHLQLAKSTAAMIDSDKLITRGEQVKFNGSSLEARGICSDAKFAQQITVANCSGFLVGDKYLVTAGHCIRSASDCRSYSWVFDFAINSAEQPLVDFSVPKSSVYKCKRVIEQALDRASMDDYALIELERTVTDREPLQFRTEGKVSTGTSLVVIGHPTGLPSKVAGSDVTIVRDNSKDKYFVSNLDTFGGNSGSAVFDHNTGTIEGILVRGETDYEYDSNAGCRRPKVCTNSGCRGEDVTRITNIRALKEFFQTGVMANTDLYGNL